MPRSDEFPEGLSFSDRDDDMDDMGGGYGGGSSYDDEDEDEEGGFGMSSDTESLWDSADE